MPREQLRERIFAAALELFRADGYDATTVEAIARRARWAEYFRACQRQGTVAADVDPVVAGHMLADLWSATAQDWIRGGKESSLEASLAAKVALLFAGLAPKKRAKRGR